MGDATPGDEGETGRIGRIVEVGRAVFYEFRAENLTFLAGSIAYHAFVSLLPLFLLLLTVVNQLQNASLRESVVLLMQGVLTPGAADPIIENVESAGAGVSLLGAVFLVWGTLRIFRGLDTAFSDIYESESENTFVDQLRDGLLVLATFALAVIAAALVSTALPLSGAGPLAGLLRWAFLVVVLGVVFLPMYYVFPDSEVEVVEVLPGTGIAAIGLAAFESLFGLYVGSGGGNIIDREDDPGLVAEALARDLEALDRLLAATDAEQIVLEVGDERVRLPVPGQVIVDTQASRLSLDASLGVEFEW